MSAQTRYAAVMRVTRLVVVAALLSSACASEKIEPPLTSDVGPVFAATIECCELAIVNGDGDGNGDGNGGPKAAFLWTIEAEDDTPPRSYELASDGGLYVFADDGLTAIVARLGPSGELEWSRSLAFDTGVPADAATAAIQASAVGPDGLDVVVQRRSESYKKPYDAAALVHLQRDGHGDVECRWRATLAFGGEPNGHVGNMVREPDRLVLTGTHTESGHARSFVQRRSLDGELVVETEIDDRYYDDVDTPRIQVGGPERYVVRYSGYSPVGLYSNYASGQLFDESLTSIDRSGGTYTSDAFGRLYIVSSNATPGDQWAQPPEEPQPPTLYSVTRSRTPDAPAGETIELEVPQPQCGWPSFTLFDESLLVLRCNPHDSPPQLLGYDGSGPPDWTATIGCADANLSWGTFEFTEDRRLWVSTNAFVLSIEF
jgi:hypothetical protein